MIVKTLKESGFRGQESATPGARVFLTPES
jgi:hypothetical protein